MAGAKQKKKPANRLAMVAGSADGAEAGPILIANIAVGLLLGYGIEWIWPQSKPWGLVAALLLGIASGFYQVFKREAQLRRRWNEQKKKKKEEQQP